MSDHDNSVIIGKKATMNYVVACLTLFHSGVNRIKLKARGQAISRAIETVEMLRKAFIKDLKVNGIEIGSQTYERYEKMRNISTIEIILINPVKPSRTS